MSAQKLSKTRWKIESQRVTLYPYGLLYILSTVLAVIFAGITFMFFYYEHTDIGGAVAFTAFLLIILLIFFGFANTAVEFDNSTGRMRKKLMGFIPTKNIPFEELNGINVVNNLNGGFNYRMFRKDERYGKGITVSSAYRKNTDPNAQAFVNEAVPVIHGYLSQRTAPVSAVAENITSYDYFTTEGLRYKVKKKKILPIIVGIVMIIVGVHDITSPPWLDNIHGELLQMAFPWLMAGVGIMLVIFAFVTITFDTGARTVERKSPLGIGNKTYRFEDFGGVRTVRRSVNLIYSGTDVQMYFKNPGTGKQEIMPLINLRRSRNIERFVDEAYQILGFQRR